MAERFAGVGVGTFRHLFAPYDPKGIYAWL